MMTCLDGPLQNATPDIVRSLANYPSKLEKVYIYDEVTKSVRRPADEDGIPWMVTLLLNLHPKHVFQDGKPPQLMRVSQSLRDLANKLKWKCFPTAREEMVAVAHGTEA